MDFYYLVVEVLLEFVQTEVRSSMTKAGSRYQGQAKWLLRSACVHT